MEVEKKITSVQYVEKNSLKTVSSHLYKQYNHINVLITVHLKNHINITHKKIKAYKCEHCGKDFGRRTQFVTHQLVHTKENRYHCQICGKGFKIKQTMQTHLKGVHGIEEEQTVFCTICKKGFSTSQGLRAHINSRVHGLEKCELCSEYITVEYKNVHMKDVHGMEKT